VAVEELLVELAHGRDLGRVDPVPGAENMDRPGAPAATTSSLSG
jgi:hypothetical protein